MPTESPPLPRVRHPGRGGPTPGRSERPGAVLVEAAVAAAVFHRVHVGVPRAVLAPAALARVVGPVLLRRRRLAALVLPVALGGRGPGGPHRAALRRQVVAGVGAARVVLVVVGVLLAVGRPVGPRRLGRLLAAFFLL